ncbi:hypothetical protein FAF44_02610 [Nonomuraea sp. MG754425]|uniref:hypothetical protein n=1 Tax=Nonomuraea sp. MG754425 TaxID=2570319 RepID=UPI001F257544|nr:hypothetical protein [Nonomuraea sp. MG754425]MCF6467305.1 hypothetical protein [Nonomuraea sp. MG754425]
MTNSTTHLRNRSLLAAVIERIEHDGTLSQIENAEEPAPNGFTCWSQVGWQSLIQMSANRCGTSLCAAGYTAELADRKWLVTISADGTPLLDGEPTNWTTAFYNTGYVLADESDPEGALATICGQKVVHVRDAALRLLGLEPQAVFNDKGNLLGVPHPLFAPGTTIADLRAWLDRLPD